MPTTRRKIAFAIAAALLVILSRSVAAEPRHEHQHEAQQIQEPEKRLGYFRFEHDRYHQQFYFHMRKMDGKDCCNGEDCRPTLPLKEATPEFKAEGYDKMVYVDGDWYPVKLSEKQVSFSKEQIEIVKKSPFYQEFVEQTHVCANRMFLSQYLREDTKRFHDALINSGKNVHCILEGGVRM